MSYEWPKLDLHGFSRYEAIDKLKNFLVENADSLVCIIITGIGYHSTNGPIIKPMVKQYLNRRRIGWIQDPNNEGRLIVLSIDFDFLFDSSSEYEEESGYEYAYDRDFPQLRSVQANSDQVPLTVQIADANTNASNVRRKKSRKRRSRRKTIGLMDEAPMGQIEMEKDNETWVPETNANENTISHISGNSRPSRKSRKRRRTVTESSEKVLDKTELKIQNSPSIENSNIQLTVKKIKSTFQNYLKPLFSFIFMTLFLTFFVFPIQLYFNFFKWILRRVSKTRSIEEEMERLKEIYNCHRSCMMRLNKKYKFDKSRKKYPNFFVFMRRVTSKLCHILMASLKWTLIIITIFYCVMKLLHILTYEYLDEPEEPEKVYVVYYCK